VSGNRLISSEAGLVLALLALLALAVVLGLALSSI
jgi:hypothetical protein